VVFGIDTAHLIKNTGGKWLRRGRVAVFKPLAPIQGWDALMQTEGVLAQMEDDAKADLELRPELEGCIVYAFEQEEQAIKFAEKVARIREDRGVPAPVQAEPLYSAMHVSGDPGPSGQPEVATLAADTTLTPFEEWLSRNGCQYPLFKPFSVTLLSRRRVVVGSRLMAGVVWRHLFSVDRACKEVIGSRVPVVYAFSCGMW